MGFWRHGLETSGEFVILLRYDATALLETGRGAECRLWKLQNGIRVFHYIGKRLGLSLCAVPSSRNQVSSFNRDMERGR